MKLKTHSGAKKRFRAKPSGKIKHKQPNLRHILTKKSSKRNVIWDRWYMFVRPMNINSSGSWFSEGGRSCA